MIAGLTVAVLGTAAVWFWRRCFEDPDPAGVRAPLDGTPPAEPAEAPPPLDAPPPAEPAETPPAEPAETSPPLDAPPPAEPTETPPAEPAEASPPLDAPPPAEPTETPPAEPAEASPPLDAPPPAEPTETPLPLDGAAGAAEETAAPAATLGVRWSWRRHRVSGLQFLRVTVANGGPNAVTLTRIRLRMGAELARHADPPADLLEASAYAVELFGPGADGDPTPRTLEPGGSTEAYFPGRDVADWLYGVAERENLDRNECHLTPECVDDAGVGHAARRKVDYERWLMHGHGPSLEQYADGRDLQAAGDQD